MKTAALSQPWGAVSGTSSAVARSTQEPRGFASSAEVDAYAQRLLQEQAEAGAEPDSSLGPYVTSVLRESDTQTPVTQLAEYESLRELIQEHCWLDSDKAAKLIVQVAIAVRTKQIPADQEANLVISPNAESTLIPGDLWGDESSTPQAAGTAMQQPLHSNATFPSLGSSIQQAQQITQSSVRQPYPDAYQAEQAFESSVDILLSMNPDVSEEAARRALELVQGDVNWGQYMVDLALTAPPVCRHLLRDGCYRRDCQFSHDIDGHTCVFWMRGRCVNGAACKFRHGFDEKALEAALPSAVPDNTAESQNEPHREENPPLSSLGPTSTNNAGSIWGRTSSTSFAQVASQGGPPDSAFPSLSMLSKKSSSQNIRRVDIPQDLWHAHENRDAAVFQIKDPLERYHAVAMMVRRKDVIDLHFQSTKTFAVVLEEILPGKLANHSDGVWIVTGTGHHVGSKTHQKGGGALEDAVTLWLSEHGYQFARGRDRNGLGGALLVQR